MSSDGDRRPRAAHDSPPAAHVLVQIYDKENKGAVTVASTFRAIRSATKIGGEAALRTLLAPERRLLVVGAWAHPTPQPSRRRRTMDPTLPPPPARDGLQIHSSPSVMSPLRTISTVFPFAVTSQAWSTVRLWCGHKFQLGIG